METIISAVKWFERLDDRLAVALVSASGLVASLALGFLLDVLGAPDRVSGAAFFIGVLFAAFGTVIFVAVSVGEAFSDVKPKDTVNLTPFFPLVLFLLGLYGVVKFVKWAWVH